MSDQKEVKMNGLEFGVFFLFFIVISALIFFTMGKNKEHDLITKAIFQEVVYLGNGNYLQCVNNHYLQFSSVPSRIINNTNIQPLANVSESCQVIVYNNQDVKLTHPNKAFIQLTNI